MRAAPCLVAVPAASGVNIQVCTRTRFGGIAFRAVVEAAHTNNRCQTQAKLGPLVKFTWRPSVQGRRGGSAGLHAGNATAICSSLLGTRLLLAMAILLRLLRGRNSARCCLVLVFVAQGEMAPPASLRLL